MVALYRLVELSSGSITLDGVDISTIGLTDLRSKIASAYNILGNGLNGLKTPLTRSYPARSHTLFRHYTQQLGSFRYL